MKLWYTSKTLWVNLLAIAVLIINAEFGYYITPDVQIVILGGINAILRIITKEEIVWHKADVT